MFACFEVLFFLPQSAPTMSTEVQPVPVAPAGPTADPVLPVVSTETNTVVTEHPTATTAVSTPTASKFFSREKKKGMDFLYIRQESLQLFKNFQSSLCNGGSCLDYCLLTLNVSGFHYHVLCIVFLFDLFFFLQLQRGQMSTCWPGFKGMVFDIKLNWSALMMCL